MFGAVGVLNSYDYYEGGLSVMGEELRTPETEANVLEAAASGSAEAAVSAAAESVEASKSAAEETAETAKSAAGAGSEEAAPEAGKSAEEAAPEAKEHAEEAAPAQEEPKAAEQPAESMADYEAEIDASLRRYERGEKVKCTVVSVDMDKIMVELGSTTGIIRKQDASDDPAFNLQENVKPGDEVEASVVRPDDGHGNVVLSMKAASSERAWDRLTSLLSSKEPVTVKISAVTKSGVTTTLEGVRAFIPASKLSLGFVSEDDLKDWVGKSVDVRVITAQKDGKKLVLSAKELLREQEAAQRKEAAALVKVGLVTEGTVETLKDYGAFINLGKGVTGLLHVSQISQKRIKTPSEVLKEGEKVKVKVIKVADGRISLSMKVLEDAAPAEEKEEKISFKLPKSEAIGTGLGDLLKGLKL